MPVQREWFEKDYYQVLGVSSTATDKDIARAYRKLAKQYHPDANPGSEDRFKEISAAHDVLGDPATRKEYDEARRLGPMAGGFGTPGSGGTFRMEDIGDLGDLFGGLFGGVAAGAPRAPSRGRHRGRAAPVASRTRCAGSPRRSTCRRTRAAGPATGPAPPPGTSTHVCDRCNGRGTLDDNQGLFSLSTVCPKCNGRGTLVDTPCPTCHGTGTERRNRQVKVRIPAGVEDGQRIRVKGRGAARPGHGAAGRPLRHRARRDAPRSSAGGAPTSPTRCRSPSPRPRSAP